MKNISCVCQKSRNSHECVRKGWTVLKVTHCSQLERVCVCMCVWHDKYTLVIQRKVPCVVISKYWFTIFPSTFSCVRWMKFCSKSGFNWLKTRLKQIFSWKPNRKYTTKWTNFRANEAKQSQLYGVFFSTFAKRQLFVVMLAVFRVFQYTSTHTHIRTQICVEFRIFPIIMLFIFDFIGIQIVFISFHTQIIVKMQILMKIPPFPFEYPRYYPWYY